MLTTVYLAAVIGILIAAIFLSWTVVPHSQWWLVERLGRKVRVLTPGLHFIVPFVDRVRHRVSMKDHVIEIAGATAVTEDNVSVTVDVTAVLAIEDPVKATYAVGDLVKAVEVLVRTNLKPIMKHTVLQETLTNSQELEEALRGVVEEGAAEWGANLRSARIANITRRYPAYYVEAIGSDRKVLTVVIPGFTETELTVELDGSRLIVRGTPIGEVNASIRPEIASAFEKRPFECRFQLSEFAEITGAKLEHGLLQVDVLRREPPATKTRIDIHGEGGNGNGRRASRFTRAA